MTSHNPVYLRRSQVDHVVRINDVIWQRFPFAIDTSVMGAGKTHTSSYLAKYHNFRHIIVVCPVSVENRWYEVTRDYNLNMKLITSYEGLRSVTNSQPKHGLLTRYDFVTENKKRNVHFEVTDEFKRMVSEGCLLIADEFHRVKNRTSSQHKAFKAMATHLVQHAGTSRLLLLSGTPMDKQEQVIGYMRILGIITKNLLSLKKEGVLYYKEHGVGEMLNYCKQIDPVTTANIMEENKDTFRHRPNDIIYELYVHMLQYHISSSMPKPDIESKIVYYNGYFKMSDEANERLRKAIDSLTSAAHYDADTEQVGQVGTDFTFGDLTRPLIAIEMAKMEIWLRKVTEILDSVPGSKVVLALNYRETIDAASQELARYNPLIINGAVKREVRRDNISLFQQSNNDYRLIIGTVATMAEGIDLDDQHGDFPRYAFASPSYHILPAHQFTHRFHRINTCSTAEVCFVYGSTAVEETNIMNAISHKSRVMEATLTRQVEEGALFPGQYPKRVEE